MKRRSFLKKSLLAAGGLSALTFPAGLSLASGAKKRPLLNAYYFRAHTYTLVPAQVRDDMRWMADVGTNAVSVAVLEQDLFAAVENIEIICTEAEKAGMQVFAVPSRWGGMVAGAPKVPSLFSVHNPQTWMLEKDGTPVKSAVSGVISSVHYPEVLDFFCATAEKMFELWNIQGVIWDEPKSFRVDYSAKAKEKLGENASWETHLKAVCDFYSQVNAHIKQAAPGKTTALFSYAHSHQSIVEAAAQITGLDYFGCDGRPWYNADGGQQEGSGKVLLGQDAGERFLKAARKHNKKSLMLIENHNMPDRDTALMDKRLPQVLALAPDQIIYYYYPRNIQSPDQNMSVLKKHLGGI